MNIKESDNDYTNVNLAGISTFLALWVVFTFLKYGVWVPAGLFLPGIIIGSCIGVFWMEFMLFCGLEIY